jgi:hypothetical protein
MDGSVNASELMSFCAKDTDANKLAMLGSGYATKPGELSQQELQQMSTMVCCNLAPTASCTPTRQRCSPRAAA